MKPSVPRPCSAMLLKCVFTLVFALAIAAPASAHGRLVDVDVVDRTSGEVLPVVTGRGQQWIVGVPGHEYLLRIRNRTAGRVLAVTSVDGVNVVSGETASPLQSGYVLDAGSSVEIAGWRKSLATTASFYFTDLGDAYATRTNRPDNVGVIGIAVFRERRIAVADEPRAPAPKSHAESPAAERGRAQSSRDELAGNAAPAPSLGTGHGRQEDAPATRVRFERESRDPVEIVAIRYDRRENLVALGILPPATLAHAPRPFPDWNAGFVADPPLR